MRKKKNAKTEKVYSFHTKLYHLGLKQNQGNRAQILIMGFHCRIKKEFIVIHSHQLLNYDEDFCLINIFQIKVKIILSSIRLIAKINFYF